MKFKIKIAAVFIFKYHSKRLNSCPNIYIFPVTDNEVDFVTRCLKGKFSAGFDEIPEYLNSAYNTLNNL